MNYPGMIFLLYIGAMIWSVIESRKKWRTIGVMATAWISAIFLVFIFSLYSGPASALALFGVPSFIVPAIAGVIHARRHRYDLSE